MDSTPWQDIEHYTVEEAERQGSILSWTESLKYQDVHQKIRSVMKGVDIGHVYRQYEPQKVLKSTTLSPWPLQYRN